MSAPIPPTVKGWCPTVARPMISGDGFLMRIAIDGPLQPAILARIGDLAEDFGNGLIDLTQRGNLQIRGVQESQIDPLRLELWRLGLFNGDGADAPYIIGATLAGFDKAAPQQSNALIGALHAGLDAPDAPRLPPKFCLLVDDGGFLSLDDVAADIRLVGMRDGFIIAIGSQDDLTALALVPPEKAAEAALNVAHVFSREATRFDARRMSDLIKALDAAEIARMAGFTDAPPHLPARSFSPRHLIGIQDSYLGLGAPFGRLESAQIKALAAAASGDIRVTPWRSLLVSSIEVSALSALEKTGLIVTGDDPRLDIIACPGRPACASGEIDTRSLAATLAPVLKQSRSQDGPLLHLSGCKKGCARGEAAPLTFVGEHGAIACVRNGRAGDAPDSSRLTEAQAQALVADLFPAPLHAKVGS